MLWRHSIGPLDRTSMSRHVGEANTGLLGNTKLGSEWGALFIQDKKPFNNDISQPIEHFKGVFKG